jgi:hypothetical protein
MAPVMTNPLYAIADQMERPTALPDRSLEGWAALADGFLSSDLKCSPVAGTNRDGSPRASDSVRIATWLPSGPPAEGGTCPGCTTYCHRDARGKMTCYACRLETRPTLRALTNRRLEVWQSLSQGEKVTLASAILVRAHAMQTNPSPLSAHAGHPVQRPVVRLGAGGDLLDASTGQAYADALAWASLPESGIDDLRVWIYSRSYGLDIDDPLGPIADGIRDNSIRNCSAYLSTDPEMIQRTRRALTGSQGHQAPRYAHLPVSVLASSMSEGRRILDTLRGPQRPREIVCPTDRPTKPLPIASRRPGEPHASGICPRCRACIDPHRPSSYGSQPRAQDVIFVRR